MADFKALFMKNSASKMQLMYLVTSLCPYPLEELTTRQSFRICISEKKSLKPVMGRVRVWDNNKAIRLGLGKKANIISNQPTAKIDKNGNSYLQAI